MSVRLGWLLAAIVFMISATNLVGEEPQSADQASAPAVGDPLPAFESTDDEGNSWKSADHVGKMVLVFYFYPGDFNSGCIRQAEAYREGLAKIEELDVELVGVSGDEVATHKLFKDTFGLKHRLLADPQGELAALMGVPIRGSGGKVRAVNAERKPLLDVAGNPIILDRPATMRRWTLVVNRDGTIASIRSILDPVADTAEILKIVAALPK